jgi:hypothetical protein
MKASNPSWLKTDVKHLSSIKNFSHYRLISLLTTLLSLFYLFVAFSLKYDLSTVPIDEQDFQNLQSMNLEKQFLLGSLTGLIAAAVICNAVMMFFSHRLNFKRIPEWLKSDDLVKFVLSIIQATPSFPKVLKQ